MPLTRLITAFGVVTICLVSLLLLFGLVCIFNSIYFRYRIKKQGYSQLGYFNKPWIIRITFILFTIWWGVGEILRLSFIRRKEKQLHAFTFDPKWQEGVCKFYIISNLGFAEPCLFLTILLLLRASLKEKEFGNWKTGAYVLLGSLPLLILQTIVALTGAKINQSHRSWNLPHYFTSTAVHSIDGRDTPLCIYPLISTIFLGVYASGISLYLLWLGRRMMSSVINKCLRRRVFLLIFSVSSLFPLRVVLLGLSVLSRPEQVLYEALVFGAFLVLLSCASMGVCMLVYCPVADSLVLKQGNDLETGERRRRRTPLEDQNQNHHDEVSLGGNQSVLEASSNTSIGRNSDESTKRGSISFRTMLKDETSGNEVYEELSLFSRVATPPSSPPQPGESMFSPVGISR